MSRSNGLAAWGSGQTQTQMDLCAPCALWAKRPEPRVQSRAQTRTVDRIGLTGLRRCLPVFGCLAVMGGSSMRIDGDSRFEASEKDSSARLCLSLESQVPTQIRTHIYVCEGIA